MSFLKKKNFFISGLVLMVFFLITFKAFAFFSQSETILSFNNSLKNITINDNGLFFQEKTKANSVAELLQEKNIILTQYDKIFPAQNSPLYPGEYIEIKKAVSIKILVDKKVDSCYVTAKTVRQALEERGIELTQLDQVQPKRSFLIQNKMKIIVTRVKIQEITKKEPVQFKIIVKKNSQIGWRKKKIKIFGEKGSQKIKYRITYKNGKIISQVVLEKKIIKKPISQIELQGTYLKLGKINSGQGSWYEQTAKLKNKFPSVVNNFAASTTIPKGGYAKVTNISNGKSVIVQINDYGPKIRGRIIDLDKVAFQKIASVWRGVINVKVRIILN